MKQGSGQTNPPGVAKLLEEFSQSHWKSLEVRIKTSQTLVIFLLSKVIAGFPLTEIERIALFSGYEKMILLCEEDPGFKKKYFWILWISRAFIQSLGNNLTEDDYSHFRIVVGDFQRNRPKMVDSCIYYGMTVMIERELVVRIRTRFPIKVKEKSRIAVGYRDHGAAKNPSEGSPSWQEVAMANIDNEEFGETDGVNLFRQIRCHQSQLYASPARHLGRGKKVPQGGS